MPIRRLIAAGFAAAWFAPPVSATTVVEYYHPVLDHYFMTPLANEIDALDNGRLAGWGRTGFTFDAFDAPAESANPVCRFYIPPQHGDSHFFSASPTECADVRAKVQTDPDFSGYQEETSAEFYIALPDTQTGACSGGTTPVYRLWNQRADSNHRYVVDAATREAMVGRGYKPEGYGPLGVAMCTSRTAIGDSRVRVTDLSPYVPGCDRATSVMGVLYAGTEVEPYIAVDPQDAAHLIGVWQQDRWSDGGARGLRTGYSFDGGLTWTITQAAFSRCSGGNPANGADYERASDPWVTIGPDGIAYQIAIAFTGDSFRAGTTGAVLASRSTDGGRTWSAPFALIRDGSAQFNDKEAITADPLVPGRAYAAWDRLEQSGHGPAYFARTTDGGVTWEAARPIYDPGDRNQTLNNHVVVAAGGGNAGALYNFFTEFVTAANNTRSARLAFLRSNDGGASFSGLNVVATMQAVGTRDPQNPARTVRDAANIASVAAGGNGVLVAAWQDGRFSAGARDGIAFSRSTDGGATWSAPVQVNRVPTAAAFLPAVAILGDGTIGIQYYDLRSDTADPATLLADIWLATSANGVDWSERHVAGPFDFNRAPVAEGGLFVGDYQGLASAAGEFIGFYAQANPLPASRSDVFAAISKSHGATTKERVVYRASLAAATTMTSEWAQKTQQAIGATLARRLVGGSRATTSPP